MQVSDRGLHLITSFEGFPNGGRPYNDPVGYATVGFGHLIGYRHVNAQDAETIWVHGQKHPGVLLLPEATQLLAHDLVDYETAVDKMVTRRMSQGQFDALVSFAYNVGIGALRESTLLREFNQGSTQAAADQFPLWCKAGGRTLPGLQRRRTAERELFLLADVDPLADYTPHEIAWIREHDQIKRDGGNPPRLQELTALMIADRKRVWRKAQTDGWGAHHRAKRYHSLLVRTSA